MCTGVNRAIYPSAPICLLECNNADEGKKIQWCRLRKICSLSTQHTNYGYIASHILVSWNKDKHNMQYEKCQYIVWEMHCFKRFFLIKLWEMHVNILILIIIYLIIRQVLLFMRIWEMILFFLFWFKFGNGLFWWLLFSCPFFYWKISVSV